MITRIPLLPLNHPFWEFIDPGERPRWVRDWFSADVQTAVRLTLRALEQLPTAETTGVVPPLVDEAIFSAIVSRNPPGNLPTYHTNLQWRGSNELPIALPVDRSALLNVREGNRTGFPRTRIQDGVIYGVPGMTVADLMNLRRNRDLQIRGVNLPNLSREDLIRMANEARRYAPFHILRFYFTQSRYAEFVSALFRQWHIPHANETVVNPSRQGTLFIINVGDYYQHVRRSAPVDFDYVWSNGLYNSWERVDW